MGRKRSIATDAFGLLLAVVVCAASVHENNAGIRVLNQAKALHPTITKVWVDQGFKNRFVEHAATLGVHAEVVTRNPEARGFDPVIGVAGARARSVGPSGCQMSLGEARLTIGAWATDSTHRARTAA